MQMATKRHRRHKIHQRERHEPRGILTTDEPGVFYGGSSPRNGHVRVRTCLVHARTDRVCASTEHVHARTRHGRVRTRHVHGRTDIVNGRTCPVCIRTLRARARTGAVRPGTGREGRRETPPNEGIKPETSRAREKRAAPPGGTKGTKQQFVQARSCRAGMRIYSTAKCAGQAKSVLAASGGIPGGSRFGIRVQRALTVANN